LASQYPNHVERRAWYGDPLAYMAIPSNVDGSSGGPVAAILVGYEQPPSINFEWIQSGRTRVADRVRASTTRL